MGHCNPAERKSWNKFKLEFRKTHPDLKHDTRYYQPVRALYKARDAKTLDELLVTVRIESNGQRP